MRLMKMGIAAAMMTLAFVSSASAQRDARDAADRGQRLDLDAIRNDMLQRQLKAPEHPLVSAPASVNPAPAKPVSTNKRKKTEKKS